MTRVNVNARTPRRIQRLARKEWQRIYETACVDVENTSGSLAGLCSLIGRRDVETITDADRIAIITFMRDQLRLFAPNEYAEGHYWFTKYPQGKPYMVDAVPVLREASYMQGTVEDRLTCAAFLIAMTNPDGKVNPT